MRKKKRMIAVGACLLILLIALLLLVWSQIGKEKVDTKEDAVLKNSMEMILDEEEPSKESRTDAGEEKQKNGENSKDLQDGDGTSIQGQGTASGSQKTENKATAGSTTTGDQGGQQAPQGSQTDKEEGSGGNPTTDKPEDPGKPQEPEDGPSTEPEDPEKPGQGNVIWSDDPYELPLIPIS